ncbi:MAG: tRNA adenosine(34) deaminase TadA [Candidatus Omnitrophota bacterium]
MAEHISIKKNKNKKSADADFMLNALRLAGIAFDNDEVPVGAVVVRENKVIAKGYNQVELLSDPTAHAEILALTSACAHIKSKWLENCTLYVTIEPCAMCAGALILSRISRVVFGAADPKTGAFGSKTDVNKLGLNHKIKVKKGVLEKECAEIIREFFKNKRRRPAKDATWKSSQD